MAFLMKKSGSQKLLVMVYAVRSENPEEWLQSNTCQLGFHHNAFADNNVPLHNM
jgi:hypothetical protein